MSTWPAFLVTALLVASIVVLLAASLHDVVARTVPNWMAATLAVFGLVIQVIHVQLLMALLAGLIVFTVSAFCWRRGWMGGGDVKLLAAAALVVSPNHVSIFVAAVAVSGAFLAVLYLVGSKFVPAPTMQRPSYLITRALRVECWRIRRAGPLPYALAIAAGFLFITLYRRSIRWSCASCSSP